MADEIDFDEDLLFSEFDVAGHVAAIPPELSPCQDKYKQITSTMDVEALKQENCRLKQLLKRLVTPETDKPFFHAIFFNNEGSTESRQRLESFLQQSFSTKTDCIDEPRFSVDSLQPSLCELNDFIVDVQTNLSKKESCDLQSKSHFSVVNYSQYFEFYCVDSCGLPLASDISSANESWDIPTYEQVFFTAIPCDEKNSSKVKVRRKRTCFNCGNVGHNVNDCPEPQNQARINSQRQQFIQKFSSPIAMGKRYHIDEKRFGAYKPGVISAELRNAMGIKSNEVPLFIYKMRQLGYPPGYLPNASNSTLVLYNAEGNVEDYVMEDLDQEDELPEKSVFVLYPGFNYPLPDGIKDRSREYGFPSMSPHQSIQEMENWHRCMQGQQTPRSGRRAATVTNKRSWVESNAGGEAMELDQDQSPCTPDLSNDAIDTGTKRRKNDFSDGGYSPTHPNIQCGTKEQLLLHEFHQNTSTKPHGLLKEFENQPPLPCDKDDTTTKPAIQRPKLQKTRSSGSLEDGEVISDEEDETLKCSKGVDVEEVKMNQGWWLSVPLTPGSYKPSPVTPPPVPSVKLPMDLLTRFYTSSTVLQSVSFEDRIMWLDPIYGNIQVSSGRYDKLKEILQQRKTRKKGRH